MYNAKQVKVMSEESRIKKAIQEREEQLMDVERRIIAKAKSGSSEDFIYYEKDLSDRTKAILVDNGYHVERVDSMAWQYIISWESAGYENRH